jgi:hypothetical protein
MTHQPDDDLTVDDIVTARGRVQPTEAQERVAMELRGQYVALLRVGFDSEQALRLIGNLLGEPTPPTPDGKDLA